MNQSAEAVKGPSALPAPREIVIRDTGALVAYACPNAQCGQLFLFTGGETEEGREQKRALASAHCVKTCSCGQPIEYHYLLKCPACRALKAAQKEQRALDRAVKISVDDYPDHPIFWEGRSGNMGGDGYFSDLDALLDHCEQEGLDLPKYVWACYRHDFKINARELIAELLERQDIDSEAVRLPESSYAELQQFLNTWIANNAGQLHAWFQDTNRVVLLRQDENG